MFVFNPNLVSAGDEEGADDTVYKREDDDEEAEVSLVTKANELSRSDLDLL